MPFRFKVRLKDYEDVELVLISIEGEIFQELTKRVRDELMAAFGFEEDELVGYERLCEAGGAVFGPKLNVDSVLKEGEEIVLAKNVKPKPKAAAPVSHTSTVSVPDKQQVTEALPEKPVTASQPKAASHLPLAIADLSIEPGKTNVSLLNEYCLRTFHESPEYQVGESLSSDEPFKIRITLPRPDERSWVRQYTGTTRRKTAKHHLAGEVLRALGQSIAGDTGPKPRAPVALGDATDSNETQRLNEYCGRHFQGCPTFEYHPDPIPNFGPYEVILVMPAPDGRHIRLTVNGVSKKEARRQVCAIALKELASGISQKQQPTIGKSKPTAWETAPPYKPPTELLSHMSDAYKPPHLRDPFRAVGFKNQTAPLSNPWQFGAQQFMSSQPSNTANK